MKAALLRDYKLCNTQRRLCLVALSSRSRASAFWVTPRDKFEDLFWLSILKLWQKGRHEVLRSSAPVKPKDGAGNTHENSAEKKD